MSDLRERVSYLQGLAEGLAVDSDGREGKLLAQVIAVLGEMAGELERLGQAQQDLEEYVSALDESIGELEEDYYGEEPEEEADEEEDDDEEEGYIEVECPKCHEKVYFEEDVLDDHVVTEITCPQCGEVVFSTDNEPEEVEPEEQAKEPLASAPED